MTNSRLWLCRLSSRWDKEADPQAWERLLANPDLEAFKVKLARAALPLVEAQAQAQSSRQTEAPSVLADNAAKLDLMRSIFLLIDKA